MTDRMAAMNGEGGFTRHFRRMWQNPAFRTKQEAAVFAWMIDAAQWREQRISTRFGPVTLKAGELLVSERDLARDFGLHRNTLRCLLHRMVAEGIIERFLDRTPHRAGTIVSIRNYGLYQGSEKEVSQTRDRNGTANGAEAGPKEDRSGTNNYIDKEGNEEKEGKEVPPNPPRGVARGVETDLFEEFWRHYPRKVGKGAARKAWPSAVAKARAEGGGSLIIQGLLLQLDLERFDHREGGRFIKHPATWLNGECWLDGIEPEDPEPDLLSAAAGMPSGAVH